MKNLLLITLLSTIALAVPIANSSDDDNCAVEWVILDGDAPSTGSAPTSTPSSASVSSTAPSGSGPSGTTEPSDSTSGSDMLSSNHAGQPGFPVSGTHVTAPRPDDVVPENAATFTPSAVFSGQDFKAFYNHQRELKQTKWLKVLPGVYTIDLDKDSIRINMGNGGFTFDFRDVTWLVSRSPGGAAQFIYINQCEDTKILGGTVWFDQGEPWSQAKIVSIDPVNSKDKRQPVTYKVDDGYDLDVWKTANGHNQACIDSSNPDHFELHSCTFWMDKSDFSKLESDRTFTLHISADSGLKVGYSVTIAMPGTSSGTTISSENNGGLYVKGLTSNGGLSQWGLGSKTTATFEDVYNVNPPLRKGYAPRVRGPTKVYGHVGGFDYNGMNDPPPQFVKSYWQYTGCEKDLKDMADQTLPGGSVYQ